jgi:uncharacterized protein
MVYVRRLIWNPGGVAHVARHQVTPDEVEEVCHGEHIVRQAYGGRIMLIGLTRANKMLSVILEPEGEDVYYPVTARSASRKEQRIYRNEKGGESG